MSVAIGWTLTLLGLVLLAVGSLYISLYKFEDVSGDEIIVFYIWPPILLLFIIFGTLGVLATGRALDSLAFAGGSSACGMLCWFLLVVVTGVGGLLLLLIANVTAIMWAIFWTMPRTRIGSR